MIEEFSGICHNTLSALLSIYTMQDWGMTWVQFLEQFTCEILDTIGEWQNEAINEEEEE